MAPLRPTVRELLALHQRQHSMPLTSLIAICFWTELVFKDVSVRENLHSIFCLAFIPEDGVVPCWAELKPILSLNPSLLPVLDYVKSMWVFNNIYPIHMWNVYRAVIDGGLRTNKFSEGHNHAVQLTTGCSHPGIELLVEIPILYNTDVELNIKQTLSGMVVVPNRKEKCANFDPNITIAVT